MKTPRDHFRQFGPDVVQLVENHLLQHNDMRLLLERFSLQVPTRLEPQMESLSNFIFKYGIAFFLQAVRNDLTREQIETLKARKLVGYSDMHGRGSHEAAMPPRPGDARAASSTPIPRYPMPLPSQQDAQPPPPLPTYGAGAPQHGDMVGGKMWIATETYTGLDRRSGKERRTLKRDRRASVDVVFKNRRFGGRERRKDHRRDADRTNAKEQQDQRARETTLPDGKLKA